MLQEDEKFLTEVFAQLTDEATDDSKRRELVSQTCQISWRGVVMIIVLTFYHIKIKYKQYKLIIQTMSF